MPNNTYQRTWIYGFILHITMCSPFLHPQCDYRYRLVETGGNSQEWKHIFVTEFGPDLHFSQYLLE